MANGVDGRMFANEELKGFVSFSCSDNNKFKNFKKKNKKLYLTHADACNVRFAFSGVAIDPSARVSILAYFVQTRTR